MDPKLVTYYRGSVGRRIATLEAARRRLRQGPGVEEAGEEIRRIAHSLKGTGSSYGFPEVSEAAGAVEEAALEDDFSQLLERLLAVLGKVADPGAEV